jgi:hypothetical protein
VLAAILANLQNAPLVEVPSTIKIDRGGGGPLWGPGYDVVDILAAVQSFPEIAGEHPVARAVRRTRWIGEALPKIKEAREKREAAAFMAGASLADAAAEERHRQAEAAAEARRKLADQLKIEQLVEIIDEARAPAAPKALSRGQSAGGTSPGAMIFAIGIGVAIGVMLTRSSSGRRRRALAL